MSTKTPATPWETKEDAIQCAAKLTEMVKDQAERVKNLRRALSEAGERLTLYVNELEKARDDDKAAVEVWLADERSRSEARCESYTALAMMPV